MYELRTFGDDWHRRLSTWEGKAEALTRYAATPPLTDAERAQLVAMVAESELRLRPASPQDIARVIAKLALGCRHPASDATDRRALVALMIEFLSDYPLDIVSAAANEWISTHVFFPTVSELRTLCEPAYQRRRHSLASFRRAIEASDRKRADAAAEAQRRAELSDPTKRAEIERRIAEARRTLDVQRRPQQARAARHLPLADDERERLLRKLERGDGPERRNAS